MPLTKEQDRQKTHRVKTHLQHMGLTAAASRPVANKEMLSTPAAVKAMDAEWQRLRDQQVWDESVVKKWSDIAAKLSG